MTQHESSPVAAVKVASIIETGIEMPPSRTQAKKWPLEALQIGQSFFMPGRNANAVRSGFYHRAKALKINLRIAAAEKDGTAGVRVWRVAD